MEHLQVWPPPRWANIQSAPVAGDDGAPCVLTASADGSVMPGTPVPGSAARMRQPTRAVDGDLQ